MTAPEPHDYLTEEGVVIFEEMGKFLDGFNAVEDIDGYILSMAAHYLYLFNKHAKEDPVQTFTNGTRQVSPSFSIMKDAREGFLKLSSKIGMSNKDRELMMKFKVHKEEKDDLDNI